MSRNKKKVFVIGDVHGKITMFQKILKYWNEEEEQLILMGDLGDRGENPAACFKLAKTLVNEKGAICLKGNHEDMLERFLDNPSEGFGLFEMNGGVITLETFLGENIENSDPVEVAEQLKQKEPWLLNFLRERPLFYEWKNYFFVHAGVDLTKNDWRESTDRDFVWIREGFFDQPNHTDKTFVFGHTITPMLYNDYSNTDIWQTDDGKIGIDGGAVYGGTLHGLVLNENGIVEHYHIDNMDNNPNNIL